MRSKESYAVAVRREFTARHFLIGGEWGAENELHEHHYAVEFRLKGTSIGSTRLFDRHRCRDGRLGKQVDRYRDKTLNSLPEFAGLNPSLEHLARMMGVALAASLDSHLQGLTVRIWENEFAWAEYRKEF
jgi:6-pyruvoyltetrahydropterin/6-carboxytetrahydropterin synthase